MFFQNFLFGNIYPMLGWIILLAILLIFVVAYHHQQIQAQLSQLPSTPTNVNANPMLQTSAAYNPSVVSDISADMKASEAQAQANAAYLATPTAGETADANSNIDSSATSLPATGATGMVSAGPTVVDASASTTVSETMCAKYDTLSNCTDRGFYTTNQMDGIKDATIGRIPHLDYTYTWWNGRERTSCDVCPNGYACGGQCPQHVGGIGDPYAVRSAWIEPSDGCPTEHFEGGDPYNDGFEHDTLPGGVMTKSLYNTTHGYNAPQGANTYMHGIVMTNGPQKYTPEYNPVIAPWVLSQDAKREQPQHAPSSHHKKEPHCQQGVFSKLMHELIAPLMPSHDLDKDFLESRESRGAGHANKAHLPCGRGDISEPLCASPEAKFTIAPVLQRRKPCGNGMNTAMQLLYTDTLGLANPPPSQEDCEYLRYNGYLYKEPCEYNEMTLK